MALKSDSEVNLSNTKFNSLEETYLDSVNKSLNLIPQKDTLVIPSCPNSLKEIQKGLPKITYKKNGICDVCQKGKQHKISFKAITEISTTKPLELLYMDLFALIQTQSLREKKYSYISGYSF